MVEVSDLETNVLEFRHKSFSFERVLPLGDREIALFHRRETENESKLRPKILRLFLAVPLDWIIYDLAADLLVLGRDGHLPGPRPAGTAAEAAADTREFREQGIDFVRSELPEGFLYVPKELRGALSGGAGLNLLGLGTP